MVMPNKKKIQDYNLKNQRSTVKFTFAIKLYQQNSKVAEP